MMREEALKLLKKHNKGEYRIFHALSVEAGMRYFAALTGEDVEYWGTVGILHDVDFEEYPGQHCKKNPEILAAAGYDEAFIRAVQSHGFLTNTNVEPILFMEKVLYTLNELVSLVSDSAFAIPFKSLYKLTIEDIKEKEPIEGFAPKANREIIKRGCEMLDMSFEDVALKTLRGMRLAAKALGLDGHK